MAIRTDSHGRHTVEFQLRGIRVHRRCPPGTTKAEAGELETRLRREIFATRDLGREPTIDLATAVATCLAETARGTTADKPRMHHAHALVDYLIGKTVHDIPTVAETYRADAIAAGLALATVNARLNVLKKVAKWAWRVKGWTRENLSARIGLEDPKNERQRYESMANVRKLIRGMETAEGRAWVALAAGTGLRAGELHRLQRTDVRDGALVVRPAPGRKGTGRVVPVADWALPYLRAIPFTRTRGELDREYRVARKVAGVTDFTHHDLRHTYASLLINKGVDLYVTGTLLGQRTPKTTQRYAHLVDATLRAAVKKLG